MQRILEYVVEVVYGLLTCYSLTDRATRFSFSKSCRYISYNAMFYTMAAMLFRQKLTSLTLA